MTESAPSARTPEPPPGPEERFAANLKRMRESHGWNQSELARRLTDAGLEGFHQTTVSRIEKGDRPVRLGEATVIAQALRVPVESMTGSGDVLGALARIRAARAEARRAELALEEAGVTFRDALAALRRAVGDPNPDDREGEHSPWVVEDRTNVWSEDEPRRVLVDRGFPGESPDDPIVKARRLIEHQDRNLLRSLLMSSPREVAYRVGPFGPDEPPF